MMWVNEFCYCIILLASISYTYGMEEKLKGNKRPIEEYHRKYKYETYYYKQSVDHFSFNNHNKFNQRYLLSTRHWDQKNSGPIFFYAGNEGDITLFADNTGFMWDIAPEFKAMVLFAEHRYYGKSMPYGKRAFQQSNYTGYLTSEQALADYADLLTNIRMSTPNASTSPIIVFGGSYGGMLAAWFRIKYPHVVQGAIAASAPILQFMGMTPCQKFGQLVTADFVNEGNECADVIRRSWSALNKLSKTNDGLAWISKNWKLCTNVTNQEEFQELKDYLTNVWINLAMADYPYPASFLAPLPAHPVKVVCNEMKHSNYDQKDLLLQLFDGLSIYFNFTMTAKCMDYRQEATSQLGDAGWDYQACTEMVMPFCYDGKSDFFEPLKWNVTSYSLRCFNKWRVMPRPNMVAINYGGPNIEAASNIVFSNGLLDPWSTGGVLKNISESVVALLIPEGAHHLDLRGSDPNDPDSVINVRNEEKRHITKWIKEYRAIHG